MVVCAFGRSCSLRATSPSISTLTAAHRRTRLHRAAWACARTGQPASRRCLLLRAWRERFARKATRALPSAARPRESCQRVDERRHQNRRDDPVADPLDPTDVRCEILHAETNQTVAGLSRIEQTAECSGSSTPS